MEFKRRMCCALLGVLLLFSLLSSCSEKEELTVTYVVTRTEKCVAYKCVDYAAWFKMEDDLEDIEISSYPKKWTIPWNEGLDAEPNSVVISEIVDYHSNRRVYSTVNDFLKSGDMRGEKRYLIRPYYRETLSKYGDDDAATDETEQNAWKKRDECLAKWRDKFFEGGEIIEKIGMILWTGTRQELLSVYEPVLICFVDDFESIHGMPIEKAQELIEAGELDIWSCPVEGSPLYNKTPDEIAAYLAAQE